MNNAIEIKPVRIADHYEVVAQLMHGLHEHEKELFDKTAKWYDIALAYMRHVISMQEENDGICLIAYDNDKAVGFLFGYTEEPDDSRIEVHTGKELYVSDGYVKPEYRRKGIYKRLNEQMENHYSVLGIKRIIRFTLANNYRMQSFLEKEGYVVTRYMYEKWIN